MRPDDMHPRPAPPPGQSSASQSVEPCYRCGFDVVAWKRHRVAFHCCLWGGLFLVWVLVGFIALLAIIWLPKRPYCARCNTENWPRTRSSTPPVIDNPDLSAPDEETED